jgi:hypothetical protein
MVWCTLVGKSLERKNADKLVNDAFEKPFWENYKNFRKYHAIKTMFFTCVSKAEPGSIE